nr:hypothetical protein Iba_chr13fCG9660 [Ipomoea batatas]
MPAHPLVVSLGLRAALSIRSRHLIQPAINVVKSHIHCRQLGQNLLLEISRRRTLTYPSMGRSCSIKIGLIGLLLSTGISHISHLLSTGSLGPNLVTHPRHSISCERLHARSPKSIQNNPLGSTEDPQQVSVVNRTGGIESAGDGMHELILHELVLFLDEGGGTAVKAPEFSGAICEFFPKLLDVGNISHSFKFFLLRELLDRAETHQITQIIRAEPEQRIANVELHTHAASETIKLFSTTCKSPPGTPLTSISTMGDPPYLLSPVGLRTHPQRPKRGRTAGISALWRRIESDQSSSGHGVVCQEPVQLGVASTQRISFSDVEASAKNSHPICPRGEG